MTGCRVVLHEMAVIREAPLAEVAIEALFRDGVSAQLLCFGPVFCIRSGLCGFEFRSGSKTLFCVVFSAIRQVLFFDLARNTLQLLWRQFEISMDCFFQGVVGASAVVRKGFQGPRAEVIEAVVMISPSHCPEMTRIHSLQTNEDAAEPVDLSSLGYFTPSQERLVLNPVPIPKSLRHISGDMLLTVVLAEAASCTTLRGRGRANVEQVWMASL